MFGHQAYRYELKPNRCQESLLRRTAGVSRFAYNWGLADRIRRFEENEGKEKFCSAIDQNSALNHIKATDFPWMYEVSKWAPSSALRDLDRAFRNFWRDRKTGRKTGFPKFKKRGSRDSFRVYQTRVHPKSVQLPRIGKVRTKEETAVKGRILSVTVSREADRWFASLCVERERTDPKPVEGPACGVDLGLKDFAVIADSETVEHIASPRPLAASLKRLRRASRVHSRKKKGSRNRYKAQMRLARVHRRVRNQRRDFLHKLSTRLTKTKSVIVVEDLAVKNLVRNHCLARAISDAGWGEFRRMLDYKSRWYGSQLLVADRFYPSSKRCSDCGHVLDKLLLKTREWVCPACGVVHDRDENAANNLRLLSTESSSGSHACGEPTDGAQSVLSVSHGSLKQESNGSRKAA